MNIYYEIADACIDKYDGNKYLVQPAVIEYQVINPETFQPVKYWNFKTKPMQFATRAWLESDAGVRFVKNRFEDMTYPVDMKEFMWIKLKAQTV